MDDKGPYAANAEEERCCASNTRDWDIVITRPRCLYLPTMDNLWSSYCNCNGKDRLFSWRRESKMLDALLPRSLSMHSALPLEIDAQRESSECLNYGFEQNIYGSCQSSRRRSNHSNGRVIHERCFDDLLVISAGPSGGPSAFRWRVTSCEASFCIQSLSTVMQVSGNGQQEN